ncbi:MAG: hypothetical protein AAF915_01400 [Cyanobacteria bacterium P01_D01_bin.50]
MVSNFKCPIKLLRAQDNQVVDAIITGLTSKHIKDFVKLWQPQLKGSDSEDSKWNWQDKNQRAGAGNELYAVECEGITQGLMIIEIFEDRCQIKSQLREPLVHVDYIATAPWNRKAINNPPIYKGVGGNLIDFAVDRSHELGYKGRIGLHSLPDAVPFYRKIKIGLIDCGVDPDYPDELVYFESLSQD